MKRFTLTTLASTLLVFLVAGCPGPAKPAASDTVIEPVEEVADTLALEDSAVAVIPETPSEPAPEPKPQVNPEPKPEPKPEPPPKPKALPRMWAFGADKCIPCVQMRPFLVELMTEYEGKIEVKRFDVYQDREPTMKAGIQMIPTQIFYDTEEKEVFRHVGFYPKDSIVAKFRQFGWE